MAAKKNDMKKFRGTYTVPVTPFTADGKKVDEAALKRLVDFQIEEGIHGLVPLGSTGEFLSVTPDERRQIVETVVRQAAGRIPMLIGTSAEWTDEVVRTSRETESMGADGVMIIPPLCSVPTDDELFAHCKKTSDAIGIPVMVYNNPEDGERRHAAGADRTHRADPQPPVRQGIDV
jgi:4-hydroxy-tetrahydrodipicolinate synthase